MKKLFSMVVAAALAVTSIFALSGCGTASAGNGGSGEGKASDFKVGAIYINSQNDTSGYTYAHHKGITTAMKTVGLDPYSLCTEFVSAALKSLLDRDCTACKFCTCLIHDLDQTLEGVSLGKEIINNKDSIIGGDVVT